MLNQYIVIVKNAQGRISRVPTMAESSGEAQARVERSWIETDSEGMEVVHVVLCG